MSKLLVALVVTTLFGCAADSDEAQAVPASQSSETSLAAWMQANAIPALASNDPERLAHVFDRIAALAPAGYGSWGAISRGGSARATAGDIDGCRAACKACHDEQRRRYRDEHKSHAPSR